MEDWLRQRPYFNERPMLWGIPGVLAGALLALRLGAAALWIGGAAALVLGVCLLFKGKAWYALPLFLGLLLLRGAMLPCVTVPRGVYEVTGTVADLPETDREKTTAVLARVSLNGQRVPGLLELTLPRQMDVAYGKALSLRARVAMDQRGAVRGFRSVRYEAEARGDVTVRQGRASYLYRLAMGWRERLEGSADELFGSLAGPAKGMLFGDRDDLHYMTFLAYRRSGMLHLLTVSGLHVGVVCGAALELVRGRRKWLRFLFSLLLVGLFCLLTGLSPSSLRAAIMLLTVRFAHMLDRQDDPVSEIGCALALLLLIDPALLLASGFRLSIGAVWGLACLTTPVRDLLPAGKKRATGLLAGAVGVLVGTLPLLSVAESPVSWIGVPLSLLVLPVAPFFLIPGWVAVLLYPLVPGLAQALALVPKGVLLYLDALCELVPVEGQLLPPCNGAALVLWFTGMLFVSEYFLPNRHKPAYLGWGLMAAGALVWFLV